MCLSPLAEDKVKDIGCKGLDMVPPRSLGEPLGNQTSFVALDGPICSALDVKYPAQLNWCMAMREFNKSPSTILHVHSDLLLACLLSHCAFSAAPVMACLKVYGTGSSLDAAYAWWAAEIL